MKRLVLFLIIAFKALLLVAQPPDGYYSSTVGKHGEELLQAIHEIIKDHNSISYSEIWAAFEDTDKKTDGTVWDMYSSCTFQFGIDQDSGSGGTTECDVFNREHSFPSSWFDGKNPMRTDLFHIFPADKKVNNVRDNYPFGEVANPTYTSSNGSKMGPSSYPGYTGKVFEPIDEYKGDFARAYFYMVTRYNNVVNTFATAMLNGTKFPAFTPWALSMLLEWHVLDPVSQKEIDRNNAVYELYQGNRNPFIDNPAFAKNIWDYTSGTAENEYISTFSMWPNPAGDAINLSYDIEGPISLTIYDLLGKKLISFVDMGNKGNNSINVSSLPNGVYLISITHQQGITAKRLVIAR